MLLPSLEMGIAPNPNRTKTHIFQQNKPNRTNLNCLTDRTRTEPNCQAGRIEQNPNFVQWVRFSSLQWTEKMLTYPAGASWASRGRSPGRCRCGSRDKLSRCSPPSVDESAVYWCCPSSGRPCDRAASDSVEFSPALVTSIAASQKSAPA